MRMQRRNIARDAPAVKTSPGSETGTGFSDAGG
jgi:hypothetical protein